MSNILNFNEFITRDSTRLCEMKTEDFSKKIKVMIDLLHSISIITDKDYNKIEDIVQDSNIKRNVSELLYTNINTDITPGISEFSDIIKKDVWRFNLDFEKYTDEIIKVLETIKKFVS